MRGDLTSLVSACSLLIPGLMGSAASRSRRFLLSASREAPSRAGLHRDAKLMLVMKFSSKSLKRGIPTETSRGEPLQRVGGPCSCVLQVC